jgi:hypothetical protein
VGEEAPAEWLSLEQAAARLGAYRWLEWRLFEVTGRWALDDALPSAQLYFDRIRAEHAWHAELWTERLPVLDWVDPQALTRPPNPGVGALLAHLEGLGPTGGGTEGRLAALARVVLPRLVTTYRIHLERSGPAADGAVRRALRLVLADERPAWEDAELLLQRLLCAPGARQRAGESQRELEERLVGESGVGLVPWPVGGPRRLETG